MNKSKKYKKQAAFFLLICSFLFSQDWTWSLIQKIGIPPYGGGWEIKSTHSLSAFCALLFCLCSISFSAYIIPVQRFFEKYPLLYKYMDSLTQAVYRIGLFVFWGFFNMFLRSDLKRIIKEKEDAFTRETRSYRYFCCVMILSFFVSFSIFPLSFVFHNCAEVSAGIKSFSNVILLCFLLNELNEKVDNSD